MEQSNQIPEGINTKQIKIARTRTGIPCLWENSTDFSDLRRATVVYNADGTHKTAIYTKTNSQKQALVPISEGDFISKAFEDKNGYAISVFYIHEISSMKNEAVIYPVFRRSSLDIGSSWKGTAYESMVDETIAKLQENVVYANSSETRYE